MSGIQGKLWMLGHSMTELLTIAQLKVSCKMNAKGKNPDAFS